MATFNRNIITNADIKNIVTATTPGDLPKTLAAGPPSGTIVALTASGGTTPPPATPGGVTVPTADDYLTKLLKYVPLEVLGAYLLIAGEIDSHVNPPRAQAWWLGALLIGMLAFTGFYDWRALNVVRASQIAISIVGLAVYVFSIGGWFATTTWYHQWYSSIALPLFGLLVAIVKLKPLPPG